MVHLRRQIALLKGRLRRFERIEAKEARLKSKRAKRSSVLASRRARTRTIVVSRARRFGRRVRHHGMGGGGGWKGWFGMGARGIGGGELGGFVGNMVAGPTGMMIGQLGGSYVAGGVKGLVIDQVFRAITGRGGILQGIFGGGGLLGMGAPTAGGDAV